MGEGGEMKGWGEVGDERWGKWVMGNEKKGVMGGGGRGGDGGWEKRG